jgi:hypothetical protein
MSSFRDDSISVRILLSDVELALTFTDLAARHGDRDAVMPAIRNARRAYDQISSMQSMTPMAEKDAEELQAKMRLLKDRLTELGERFD